MEENKNQEVPANINDLNDAIEKQLSKIRTQSMYIGFRVACSTILNKINDFERSSGSKSNNDHKRLIKDIKKFVEQGLARNMNENGEIETPEETTQN